MRNASTQAGYPELIFFFQGDNEQGEAFFRKLWPEARAVSDMPRKFYNAFGIERGGMKEMFGGGVWACGARAAAKGHTIGAPVGDPWVMPGLFLINEDGQIQWQHDFAHAGDHPDWKTLPQQIGETLQSA
ncbi:MAG: AhpC/TSA family protein [Chloroflexota bacterium]